MYIMIICHGAILPLQYVIQNNCRKVWWCFPGCIILQLFCPYQVRRKNCLIHQHYACGFNPLKTSSWVYFRLGLYGKSHVVAESIRLQWVKKILHLYCYFCNITTFKVSLSKTVPSRMKYDNEIGLGSYSGDQVCFNRLSKILYHWLGYPFKANG